MLIMGKLRNLYTKYATIGDLLHNDIVMPNESFHLLLEDLGYTMEPLDLAHLVSKLDSEEGYVLIGSIIHKSDAPTQHWLFVHYE